MIESGYSLLFQKNNKSNRNISRIIKTSPGSGGFTIVELLVVIVVIGILAAITIVSYTGISQRAIVSSMQSDLTNAANQLKLDQVTNSNYPTTLALANGGKGILASPNTSYQYSVNNTTNPPTFCITATNGNQIYNITQDNSPVYGPCDGHSGGTSYCPESTVTSINGYYCDGTIGSIATYNTNVIRLAYNASEVPSGAPGGSVGKQTVRDNLIGNAFAVTTGEVYCVTGWATTVSSTVGHTIGLQLTGTSGTTWLTSSYLFPATATNNWLKIQGCITIPTGYNSAKYWTQNNGFSGVDAVAWYQTSLTLVKR